MPIKSTPSFSAPEADAPALIYARVSSKEQEKEGFSIPAQQKLLRGYAADHALNVVEEFIDVETAKTSGRTNFEAMVRYLKAHRSVRTVLVEKTDRLYRNLRDWVTLDDLDVEIHLVKEGIILSRDSRSSEKFVHGIKVLMAKNYIDNLSEEAKKGMLEKAEQGIWPTVAPIGYLNVVGKDGKKCIEPDPDLSPVIFKLYQWYAQGTLSIKDVGRMGRAAGLSYRKSGVGISNSGVHKILRNRVYTGDFEWKGKTYHGRHQPLVPYELWERVQDVFEGRYASKVQTRSRRNFTFTGLVKCGHCGCSVVGELKKGKYVYYHCSGYRQKCPGAYVREEALDAMIASLLGRLRLDENVRGWVRSALNESHATQREDHEAAVRRYKAEYDRLQRRVQSAYLDKLDGKIDSAFFDQMSESWREEQAKCLREIAVLQAADQSYMEEGIRILELANRAQELYLRQEASERRELLGFVLSNCILKDGQLTAKFKQPFDLITESSIAVESVGKPARAKKPEKADWLGR